MANLVSINAGFATIGQGAGPMIVTQKAGLFAKHGLDVTIHLMGGAVGVVRGLMDGAIQFGNLAAPALMRAVLRDKADLAFLTGGINQQFLLGRPGIENRRQLGGARIGIAGDGGLNDVLVSVVVEALEKDGVGGLRLVPGAISGRERAEKLARGESDAEVLTPPESIEALRRGCSSLIDFAEFGLNFAFGGIASRRSYIAEHEDITRKFIRAYVEGLHRYRTDRDFTVGVQQEYSDISDRTIAEETYDTTQPGMPRVPYPVLSALATGLKAMSKDLTEAASADPRQFVEDRYIRELDESGFIGSLYAKGGG